MQFLHLGTASKTEISIVYTTKAGLYIYLFYLRYLLPRIYKPQCSGLYLGTWISYESFDNAGQFSENLFHDSFVDKVCKKIVFTFLFKRCVWNCQDIHNSVLELESYPCFIRNKYLKMSTIILRIGS